MVPNPLPCCAGRMATQSFPSHWILMLTRPHNQIHPCMLDHFKVNIAGVIRTPFSYDTFEPTLQTMVFITQLIEGAEGRVGGHLAQSAT